MKTVAVLSIAALLLLAPSAASQVPDDRLIVPGERIGKWTLRMTVEDITSTLGREIFVASSKELGVDVQGDLRAYQWGIGLQAYTRDGRNILLLEVVKSLAFATEKGVKYGTRRSDVEIAHGRPTRVTQWGREASQATFWYDDTGLEVFFTPTSTVGGIGVFRPGTALSIWKP